MNNENDCTHCETECSLEIVGEEGFQSEYCHECGTLVITNPDGDEIGSDDIPRHLHYKLLN